MSRVLYTCGDPSRPFGRYFKKFTGKSIRRWADSMGAELVNLPEPRDIPPRWVFFEAMRASLELPDGFRAAWVDSDILVKEDAPDILSLTNLLFCPSMNPLKVHPRMRILKRRGVVLNVRPYLVSGVAKWEKRHARAIVDWFDSERGCERFLRYRKEDNKVYGDQELLVVACQDTETYFTHLPQGWHQNPNQLYPTGGYFLHPGGGRKAGRLGRWSQFVYGDNGRG